MLDYLFYATLIIYFLLNLISSVFMIKNKKSNLKLITALLPFPLFILLLFLSSIGLNIAQAAGVIVVKDATSLSGFGIGISIIMGMIMVAFYIFNFAYLILFSMKSNQKK